MVLSRFMMLLIPKNFLGKCAEIHGILSNFVPKFRQIMLYAIIVHPFLIAECMMANHETILCCCQTPPSVVVQNNLLSREVSKMLMVLISGVSDSTTVC